MSNFSKRMIVKILGKEMVLFQRNISNFHIVFLFSAEGFSNEIINEVAKCGHDVFNMVSADFEIIRKTKIGNIV